MLNRLKLCLASGGSQIHFRQLKSSGKPHMAATIILNNQRKIGSIWHCEDHDTRKMLRTGQSFIEGPGDNPGAPGSALRASMPPD
jgi:hypothetical protein